ncbi:MAG: LPS export ABC transporter permease LptF [Burkholderiales bacterium]|jgi:lipopolysaccharide export system permease protein|nr:LPS export ABC transporter permease LptF [Burkholderiales bacterium]
MIFRRSLIRELTINAAGLFAVALAILFTNLILRLLGRAASGRLDMEGLFPMLGFYALQYLHVLLAITLFLTVLLSLTRAYRDSEMIVWLSAGQPLVSWGRPLLGFAAPFLFAIVALSLFLTPWALQQRLQYEKQLESRDELSMLAPGLFREFKRVGLVVYIESINPFTGTIKNVFLQSIDKPRSETLSAQSAIVETLPNGDRFLVMSQGNRNVGTPGEADYQIVEFEQLGRRIEPAEAEAIEPTIRGASTLELMKSDDAPEAAELFWRLSIPIMALMLTLMALPLSYVNPRMGRSFNLLAAVLLYLIYSNSLNIVQSMIAQEKLSFWLGLLLPHGTAALLIGLLLHHRTQIYTLWRRPPADIPPPPPAASDS